MTETDPSSIRSLAISPADATNAYAYTQENPGDAVLRVTPPFHGRMRARLHVYQIDDTPVTGAVHVDPAAVIDDDVLAAYPHLQDEGHTNAEDEGHTNAEDEGHTNADGDDGTIHADESDDVTADTSTSTERRRKRRAEAVDRWRTRAQDAIVETVALETDTETHRVDVKLIG
ncbi:hypothetical protein D8Y22_07030 [Salinadaptatus halalkaliphilus]|uniref:DUF8009 domain-containing protein n=1 Tax=Salinadaptatus halalkaliphilus TaxID=2419781 RepID=A0A4S3TPE8_9EURY|nr:hypothetical protein [Salinadaptatus halalkaliphilus]THE65560.1 hypothetical protein D8Y22_07030 [Salinadaptatus halalkaliphilus]